MSLIDFDSWVTESDAVERTLTEIQTQIGQLRNGNQELSHSKTELSKRVRIRLSQAAGDLQTLVRKLDDKKGNPITRDELERRQRKVETLQSQHFQLNKDFNGLSGTQTTIASSIIRPTSSALWDDDHVDGSAGQGSSTGAGGEFGLQRDQMIRSQNEGLENLSKIIARQKNIAMKISEEVTEQDDILDDIAVQMENTDGRINRGTQDIDQFTRNDSSFCLWMVILGLFVAIVIVWFL